MFSKLKKKFAIVLALAMVLTLVMPVAPSAKAAGKVTITVTNLPSNTLTLKKGQSKVLKVKATGGVTYKTSKKTVATVSAAGKVTAKKNGTANITITSKKNTKTKVTIKVTVGTPVTKVKLNKTKLNLVVKQSQTLKATVTPKKPSNKKIVWKSSNEKIATVKNGKVTAKKTGTVKITAEAADGSGKKATCTVKVSKPVNLKAVAVVNGQTINFSLDSAKALTMADIIIKKKSYAHGNYLKVCNLVSLTTTDNVNYTAVIDSDSYIYVGEFAQVNIPANLGTVTAMDACYSEPACAYSSEEIVTFNLSTQNNFKDTIAPGRYGYESVTLTGGQLPTGTNVRYKNGIAYVYGDPTATGVFTAVFTGYDELGNTYTVTKTYLIGSDTQIVAAYNPKYGFTDEEISAYIQTIGGSGNYKYKFVSSDFGTELSYSGKLTAKFAVPGTYPISVQVTDETYSLSTTATCNFYVSQACSVSGIVKGADGNFITNNYLPPSTDRYWCDSCQEYHNYGSSVRPCKVTFINKNKGARYTPNKTYYPDSSTGAFNLKLEAGVYDVEATYSYGETDVTQYLYNVNIASSQSGFDITLPLYKVQVFGTNLLKDYEYWEDAYGDIYAYGNIIYLKAGSYNLTYEKYKWLKATISVSVPSAQAFTTAQIIPATAGSLGVGVSPAPVTTSRQGVVYTFVPPEPGKYNFDVNSDVTVTRYYQSENGNWNSDTVGSSYFSYENKTYYIRLSSSGPNTMVTIKKQAQN